MTQKAIIHSILLGLAIFSIFLWVTDPVLSRFSLQLTAILMIILVITRYFIKTPTFSLVESVISTMAVLLVINDTGNLTSPLFFLVLFLLFELSLLLEPSIPLTLAVLLIIYFYLLQPHQNISYYSILLAFPFITPFAISFGKIYKKEENQKVQIRALSQKISKLKQTSS
ncbi:hypothetical protein A2773_01015 [Candidatus Gottesmanbacteria bacterium RIFCSPHIGHO2_01_FULL_39_10]|uniref:Uncharacterized protein n=1 Tax=Candidatus Gottesmanbacteria bacterium RIFCSPHIGHO2_01_FULL_39_10 TaxID=1798375 RepID=A0A1F5ZNE2_9BACT|nr:MAG: hypothetical protein A2773_01015 [Candidatus Gottesmanbacteria bacterium RIFCSPHIGHO2_01_FULL_39_10]